MNIFQIKEAYKFVSKDKFLEHTRYDSFKRDCENGSLFIETEAKEITGILTYKIYKKSNKNSYGKLGDIQLKQVAIKPSYREQGLGRQLITNLINFSKQKKLNNIVLAVREENEPARKLYEKLGFKIKRPIIWGKNGSDIPGVIYNLSLKKEVKWF